MGTKPSGKSVITLLNLLILLSGIILAIGIGGLIVGFLDPHWFNIRFEELIRIGAAVIVVSLLALIFFIRWRIRFGRYFQQKRIESERFPNQPARYIYLAKSGIAYRFDKINQLQDKLEALHNNPMRADLEKKIGKHIYVAQSEIDWLKQVLYKMEMISHELEVIEIEYPDKKSRQEAIKNFNFDCSDLIKKSYQLDGDDLTEIIRKRILKMNAKFK